MDAISRRCSAVAVALLCLAESSGCSSTGPRSVPAPTAAIHTAAYVKIGGIDQWITIAGADRRNPVILFLDGGPGNAESPFAASNYAGWDKDFTLVFWDQRGAGRTYVRNGKSIEPTMTVERMTEDGIEVADYLRIHLHKRKIILVGGSWGSVLGIRMAYARPDLFYAWVGLAQATNWQQDLAASYAWLRRIAQSKAEQSNLDALNALGAPPWDSLGKWLSYAKILNHFIAEMTTAPSPPMPAIASEYRADFKPGSAWLQAEGFSFSHFWGPTLSGPLTRVDLTSFTNFKIPIYFIKGEVDLICPPDLTRAYFERIRAPQKKFYLLPGTGHNVSLAEMKLLKKVLLTEVGPIAR